MAKKQQKTHAELGIARPLCFDSWLSNSSGDPLMFMLTPDQFHFVANWVPKALIPKRRLNSQTRAKCKGKRDVVCWLKLVTPWC